MAETFTNEGIDYMMAIFPKNGTNLATSYVGLWTGGSGSPSASSVGTMNTCVLATPTGITEAAFTSYARQSVAAASWGAQAAGSGAASGGRQSTAGQVTFPAAGAAYATAILGFFLATASTAGVSIFVANFDDTTSIATLALGDIVKVTPTFGMVG